jgi:hypothetical protein
LAVSLKNFRLEISALSLLKMIEGSEGHKLRRLAALSRFSMDVRCLSSFHSPGFAAARDARSVEGVSADAEVGSGEMTNAQPYGSGAPLSNVGPDPWQALVQIGAQFVAALAAANDPKAPAHPWIERDPATGARSLKMPLPQPEIAGQLANALSALADSLRGKIT